MGARLAATVYVQEPGTNQTVRLDAGSEPPAELAALVTNPAAWEGGELPTPPKAKADSKTSADTKTSTPDPDGDDGEDPAADKKPARKTAARKPAAN